MTANYYAPELYTAAEAAEILRVKQSWLKRQAAARKIPFTMLGGAYRFTDGHLAAIVQMHEKMPSPSGKSRDSRSRSPRPLQRRAYLMLAADRKGIPRCGWDCS